MKNSILFERIQNLVATERRIGIEILECLYEIERRKAYAELRYDGLFTYCVKELGFTDSQAYQRIQAMRTLKEMPELKSKIESGALSVSSVSKAQAYFRQERKAGRARLQAEKLELFSALEYRTSREVDVKLAEARGETHYENLIVEMDEELLMLWRRVRDRSAHRSGGRDSEALKIVAREWLDRNDPARKVRGETRAVKSDAVKSEAVKPKVRSSGADANSAACSRRGVPSSTQVTHPPTSPSRYIPAALKRTVWRKSDGKCEQCFSRYALEIDHRVPFALGGKTEAENLRLLCRSCNRFASVRAFGAATANCFASRSE